MVAALFACAAFGQVPAGAPDPILEGARGSALHYSRTLPDFVCTEFIRRFGNWQGPEVRIDNLTFQLGYYQQKESYRLVARDNHPTQQPIASLNGAFSRGEFGSALRFIFDPVSEAVFVHHRRERIRRRPVDVYTYTVPLSHSRYKLSYGTNATLTAYHGRVWIDPAANRVLRLTMEVDPPDGFPIRETATTIDYDLREIGGTSYLLPVRAEVRMLEYIPIGEISKMSGNAALLAQQPMRYHNVVEFRNYRKFTTESKLSFEP